MSEFEIKVHIDPTIDLRNISKEPLGSKILEREAIFVVRSLKKSGILPDDVIDIPVIFDNKGPKEGTYPHIEFAGEFYEISLLGSDLNC